MAFETSVPGDPVSSVADAVSAVSALFTKAIPSDEQRRENFKARFPRIYRNIRQRLLNQSRRHLKRHWHEPIEPYVRLVCGALSKDEQDYIITLLQKDLARD